MAVPPAIWANFRANSLARGNVGWDFVAAADQHLVERPKPRALPAHLDMSFNCLHAEKNDGLPRPAHRLGKAQGLERMAQEMADDIPEPERDAPHSGTAIGQHGGEQAHGVGTAGIAHGFNVRVFVDVNAAADGNALREIRFAPRACALR